MRPKAFLNEQPPFMGCAKEGFIAPEVTDRAFMRRGYASFAAIRDTSASASVAPLASPFSKSPSIVPS